VKKVKIGVHLHDLRKLSHIQTGVPLFGPLCMPMSYDVEKSK